MLGKLKVFRNAQEDGLFYLFAIPSEQENPLEGLTIYIPMDGKHPSKAFSYSYGSCIGELEFTSSKERVSVEELPDWMADGFAQA